MNVADLKLLQALLTRQRVLSVGVLVEGAPWVALLPFAVAPDFSRAFVHVSKLGRHTAGLTDGAPVSALVHQSDGPDRDPLQLGRLTLTAVARPLTPGTADHDAARALYLRAHPSSEVTFGLGDFQLVALHFTSGRLVGGFARATDVGLADLAAAAKKNEAPRP